MKSSHRWTRITHAENIPLREGRAVEVDGREIAIFNLGDRFLAVENRCPHRGGPLADGIVSGRTVVCPLHAWKLDLEEGSVTKPRERACVATYPVRIDEGVVSIQTLHTDGENAPSTAGRDCHVPAAFTRRAECASEGVALAAE